MMSKHKLLAQIALLKAELAKKDKLLRKKDKKLAEQEEQTKNLEQENTLLQADRNDSVRKKKQESEINSILYVSKDPMPLRESKANLRSLRETSFAKHVRSTM
eukprot:14429230-Ditylum_brightwellii.AAC.1